MKVFAIILFAVFWLPVAGQTSDDLKLIDEFDPRHGCETLESRLDSLFVESTESQSNAIVVIHQGNNVIDVARVWRKAKNYARFRGFPAELYTVLATQGVGEIRVELWLGKNGKTPPGASTDVDMILPIGNSRILFGEDTIEIVRIDGRDTYIGTGNPSCWNATNFLLVWEFLKANRAFDAEFRIKPKSSRDYKLVAAILKKELQQDGFPTERVIFINRGRDKELEGSGARVASVEVSFVKRASK